MNSRVASQIDNLPMPVAAMAMVSGTYLCFSLMDATGKYLVVAGFHPSFVVWVRFLVHAVLLCLFLRVWREPKAWRMRRPLVHLLRAVLLPLTTVLNFTALKFLPLDVTMSFFLSTPILVTALAGPMLGEWAGLRRWAAVLVGFAGILIVVRPGTDFFSPAMMISLAAAVTYGIYTLLTRLLAPLETEESLNFYPTLAGIVLMLPFAFAYVTVPEQPDHIFAFCIAGMLGLVGHVLLIRASTLTSASKLAPFIYTQLLWMTGLGFVLFGDVPDFWTVVGAFIITASGFYLMHRERQLRLKATS